MLREIVARQDWQTQGITAVNRLPAHTPLSSWRSEGEARMGGLSPSRLLLDGEWQFSWFEAPERVPEQVLRQAPGPEQAQVLAPVVPSCRRRRAQARR